MTQSDHHNHYHEYSIYSTCGWHVIDAELCVGECTPTVYTNNVLVHSV